MYLLFNNLNVTYCRREVLLTIYMLKINVVYEILRWDMNCLDELPDYMQIFYHTLLSVIYEIEEEMVKEGRSYRVYYTKESVCIPTCTYIAFNAYF